MRRAVRRNRSVDLEHRGKSFQTRNAQVKAYARGLRIELVARKVTQKEY
jgi:hypothetical protein